MPTPPVAFASSDPLGDGFHTVHVEYDFPDAHWTQKFRSRPLTVEQFELDLRRQQVAGEAADGMILHAFTTERYLREVTLPALDPVSRQPELKHCAVRISKAELPWRLCTTPG